MGAAVAAVDVVVSESNRFEDSSDPAEVAVSAQYSHPKQSEMVEVMMVLGDSCGTSLGRSTSGRVQNHVILERGS